MFGKPNRMPAASEALPGRADQMPSRGAFRHRPPDQRPFAANLRVAMFGLVVSGVPSGCSGSAPASTRLRSVTRGPDAKPDVSRSLQWHAGAMRWSSSSLIRRLSRTNELLRLFWKATTRRKECDRATMWDAVSLGHRLFRRGQRRAAEQSRDVYRKRSTPPGRHDYDRDLGCARALLLRRGLSPAVSREESERILRARRYGCESVRSVSAAKSPCD